MSAAFVGIPISSGLFEVTDSGARRAESSTAKNDRPRYGYGGSESRTVLLNIQICHQDGTAVVRHIKDTNIRRGKPVELRNPVILSVESESVLIGQKLPVETNAHRIKENKVSDRSSRSELDTVRSLGKNDVGIVYSAVKLLWPVPGAERATHR